MSTSGSHSSLSEPYTDEEIYLNFLIERLKLYGSLPLQNLVGHLSQLPQETRNGVGTSKILLKNFLTGHKDVFQLDSDLNVHLTDKHNMTVTNGDTYSNQKSQSEITDGVGKISRVFPVYGFIAAMDPVTTNVYFQAENFVGEKIQLLSQTLKGRKVGFDAVSGPKQCKNEYRATRVWLLKNDESDDDESVLPINRSMSYTNSHHVCSSTSISSSSAFNEVPSTQRLPKVYTNSKQSAPNEKRKTGLENRELKGKGNINKLFHNSGFLLPKAHKNESVYFKSNVLEGLDFSELSLYDAVYFEAKPSSNKTFYAQWQATYVTHYVPQTHDTHRKHVTYSPLTNIKDVILRNQPGKIVPSENNAADILFGENFQDIMKTGPKCLFFMDEEEIPDIVWNFCDGDFITFDAVKRNTGWEALVVWMGEKPEIPNEILAEFDKVKHDSPVVESNAEACEDPPQPKHIPLNIIWGDTPYPDDDEEEDNEDAEAFISTDHHQKSDIEHAVKDNTTFVSYIHVESTNSQAPLQNESESFEENDEFENSSHVMTSVCSEVPSVHLEVPLNPDAPKKACVTMFDGVSGKVKKIMHFLVEINCPQLNKAAPAVWKDLYHHGTVVHEKFKSLKDVLKVGDLVNINCFEIVDNKHHLWQKVSLAWIGERPSKVKEIEPIQFIEENHLNVTLDTNVPTWKSFRSGQKLVNKIEDTTSSGQVNATKESESIQSWTNHHIEQSDYNSNNIHNKKGMRLLNSDESSSSSEAENSPWCPKSEQIPQIKSEAGRTAHHPQVCSDASSGRASVEKHLFSQLEELNKLLQGQKECQLILSAIRNDISLLMSSEETDNPNQTESSDQNGQNVTTQSCSVPVDCTVPKLNPTSPSLAAACVTSTHSQTVITGNIVSLDIYIE